MLGQILTIGLWTVATSATPNDPLHITAAEKAACTEDAVRFCSDTYPDETRLLGCMEANRAALSAPCAAALGAGMKRRGL